MDAGNLMHNCARRAEQDEHCIVGSAMLSLEKCEMQNQYTGHECNIGPGEGWSGNAKISEIKWTSLPQ